MPRVCFVFLFLVGGLAITTGGCSGDDETDASTQEPVAEGNAAPDAATAPPPPGDATTPPGPSVECAVGGAAELEPNDSVATATAFTELTFCGVLGTGSDVDYSTFVTPAGTKLTVFQAVIDGKVDFELSLGGAKFGPGETAKFGSGTYVVKAFTKAGASASYSYRIQFDPI